MCFSKARSNSKTLPSSMVTGPPNTMEPISIFDNLPFCFYKFITVAVTANLKRSASTQMKNVSILSMETSWSPLFDR